jgi:hypothetical protein
MDISEVLAATIFIVLVVEVAGTCEMSVNF